MDHWNVTKAIPPDVAKAPLDSGVAHGLARMMIRKLGEKTAEDEARKQEELRKLGFYRTKGISEASRARFLQGVKVLLGDRFGGMVSGKRMITALTSEFIPLKNGRILALSLDRIVFDPETLSSNPDWPYQRPRECAAIIVDHMIARFFQREELRNFSGLKPILRRAAAWGHIASSCGESGTFLMPIKEGMVCITMMNPVDAGIPYREGLDPGNTCALVKTFIGHDEMKEFQLDAYRHLVSIGAKDIGLKFPTRDEPSDAERRIFLEMRAYGRSWEGRRAMAQQRREAAEQHMAREEDYSFDP